MSFDFRTIRQPSGDPLLKFVNHLQRALSKKLTKDLVDQMNDTEDIYSVGQDVDSAIKVQTDLYYNHVFTFDKSYYPPLEPDKDKLRLWIRGRGMGFTTRDYSEEDGSITFAGEPVLVNGSPFNYFMLNENVGVPCTALRFNRPTSPSVNTEHISVEPTTRNRASENLSGGISFFIRFRMKDLSQQGGFSRTLFQKQDNDPVTDAVRVLVGSSGRIIFRMLNSGNQYNVQTASGTIENDTVYDVWCTYNKSGNVQHIYINGEDMELSDPGTSSSWHSPSTDFDWSIFSRGGTNTNGHTYGDLYDFKIYREKIVSQAEVDNHHINKFSISNIPEGQVLIANYWAINALLDTTRITFTGIYRYDIAGSVSELASFTTTCFTSGAFTI